MAVAIAYVVGVLAMCAFCATLVRALGRRRASDGRLTVDAVYYRAAIAAAVPWLLLLSVGEGWLGLAAVYLTWLGLWACHALEVRGRLTGWNRLHAAAHGVVVACVLLSVKSGQDASAAFVTGAGVGMVMLGLGAGARRSAEGPGRTAAP